MTDHIESSALSYARALLELADERQQTDAVQSELASLAEAFVQTPALAAFFSDPSVKQTERDGVVERAILPRVSGLLGSFVQMLHARDKVGRIPDISRALGHLLDQRHGRVDVELTVATPLAQNDLDLVRQKISTAIKKDARLNQKVDPDIIGGLVIRIGDQLVDGSVRAQLDAIRRRMLNEATTHA